MAISIRKFSGGSSELINIDKLPWNPYPDATGDGIVCTSLSVQSSGMSIGLTKGSNYGLGLYAFNGQLIKELNPDSDPDDQQYTVTKRDATQAVSDYQDRNVGTVPWTQLQFLAHDASENVRGNPTLFLYDEEDENFFSNIIGQLFLGSIGLTTTQVAAIVAASSPLYNVYYKFEILTTPSGVQHWVTPPYVTLPDDPYTGTLRAARITKIAFPDPRDSNKMTTYKINTAIAGDSDNPVGIDNARRSSAYVLDLQDTTFQDSTVVEGTKTLYNICKRSHLIPNPLEQARPIKITNNDTGVAIPISFPPLTDTLGASNHPLRLGVGVRWSGITHDRQNKYVLTTYHPNPPEDRKLFQSKMIVIPTSFSKPLNNITPLSFINIARTLGNNVVAVDEVSQLIYSLDTDTDNWRPGSYSLYRQDKLSIPQEIGISQRQAALKDIRKYPLGRLYRSGNQLISNPFYFYDEYATGASSNLFPRWIDYVGDKLQVGERGGNIWSYDGTTYVYDTYLASRQGDTIDQSGGSILYNNGRTIRFVYNAGGSTDTITGNWRCIAHYPGTTYMLLAMQKNKVDGQYLVDMYARVSGNTVKTGTYRLAGFNLINPTGIAWSGNATSDGGRIYITDSGQRDHQIQKYTPTGAFTTITETGRISYSKTINSPVEIVKPATAEATCIDKVSVVNPTGKPGYSKVRKVEGGEVCVDLPFEETEGNKNLFSGFLPINKIPKGLSGKQISVRIRVTHNRICSIGSMFIEASGPQVRN